MGGNKRCIVLGLTIILFTVTTHSAFAQEFDFHAAINDSFDWIRGFSTETIQETDIDQDKKDRINDAINEGIPVAKKGADWYISLHEFIVSQVFKNSPIEIPVAIISLVSIVLLFVLLARLFWKILRKIVYISAIVLGIAMFVILLGTNFNLI